MPVTAIKRVQNLSSSPIVLNDLEGPIVSPIIPPNSEQDVSMWVPWAPDAGTFPQHHIRVEFAGSSKVFALWQAAIANSGDFVRYAEDAAWHSPGQPVFGLADVGGDRRLVVFDDRIELAATGGRHGVTSIVRIDNGSGQPATVVALDGGAPRIVELARGESLDVDLWIPWAPSSGEFDKHNVEVKVNGATLGKLWQAQHSDGDFVRFSSASEWSDPGIKVAGNADVDGDRALIVLDGSIELESAVRRPSPRPGEGDATLTLTRPAPNQPFDFSTREDGHARATIVSVTNIARDTRDEVAVPLIVQLDTDHGNAGRHRIQPGDASDAFAGFPVDGKWTARADNISAALLKEFVTLDVHWVAPPAGEPDVVQCVTREGNGEIASIGGVADDGQSWRLTRQEAVAQLKNGRLLFVDGVNGKRTQVRWRTSSRGEEFLYTLADDDVTNNLSALPTCG